MAKISTIGCCDSGLGGMFTVDKLHKAYPNLNIVFIADQLNAPYGDKTSEELCFHTKNIIDKFVEMEIKHVVVACNTLCCDAIPKIENDYPNIKFHTIIDSTYGQLKGYDFKTINVLATSKTIDTHVYRDGLQNIHPDALVREIKATKLVPIIENNFNEVELQKAVDEYCEKDADAWILGCTHYPLIRPYIKTNGMIFDSIQPVIDIFKDVEIEGEGKVVVYTTKDPKLMQQSIRNLIGSEYEVKYIQMKQS